MTMVVRLNGEEIDRFAVVDPTCMDTDALPRNMKPGDVRHLHTA